jgi:hypothetical protein
MPSEPTQTFDVLLDGCLDSFSFFVNTCCQTESQKPDSLFKEWVPFTLWPAQKPIAEAFQKERLVVCLKARQLGLSWMAVAFALWQMVFYPIATVLLFSKRDDEATELLGRLKGMWQRLPPWVKKGHKVKINNDHTWGLSSGSKVTAFPTTAGDSYTATLAIVDEADLIEDLDRLLRSVKPTVDGGGRMLLVSRADKSRSLDKSPFKKIYLSSKRGESDWHTLFLPWDAKPGRTPEWYENQRKDILARTGALDDLHELYPKTDLEALSSRSLDKRFPFEWLMACYKEIKPLPEQHGWPSLSGLVVFKAPEQGKRYIVSGDPAAGNPSSDESSSTVIDVDSGEEVAILAGRFEPATFAAHIDKVGTWYNSAQLMIERNNHGAAVILWLQENSKLYLMRGPDGHAGWHTSIKSKAIMLDVAGESFRDKEVTVHDNHTFQQLADIQGSTLKAPEGQFDDRAISYCLAVCGRDSLVKVSTTHQLMDHLLGAVQPITVKAPNAMPEPNDKGGVTYFSPHEMYYVFVFRNGVKHFLWKGGKDGRQEAMCAAHAAGLDVPGGWQDLDPTVIAKIRAEVQKTMAEK